MKKRIFIPFLVLALALLALPAQAEAEWFRCGGYNSWVIMDETLYSLEADGLYTFSGETKTCIAAFDCTPEGGIITNGSFAYALCIDDDGTELISVDIAAGSSRVVMELDDVSRRIVGIQDGVVFTLGVPQSDDPEADASAYNLYCQHISADEAGLLMEGVAAAWSWKMDIIAAAMHQEKEPTTCCAFYAEDGNIGGYDIAYNVLDAHVTEAGVFLWMCNAGQENNYSWDMIDLFQLTDNGSGPLMSLVCEDSDGYPDKFLTDYTLFRLMDDVEYLYMAEYANTQNFTRVEYDPSAGEWFQDEVTAETYLYHAGSRSLSRGFLGDNMENVCTLPDKGDLACIINGVAYQDRDGVLQGTAISAPAAESAAPAADAAAPAQTAGAADADPTAYDFDESLANYSGKWVPCCEGSYNIFVPADYVPFVPNDEMKASDFVDIMDFMDGTLAVRRGAGDIEDAFSELSALYPAEAVIRTQMNGIDVVIYMDADTGTLNLVAPGSGGIYHFIAIPGSNAEFNAAINHVFTSLSNVN